jgi:predicted aspartyl protease
MIQIIFGQLDPPIQTIDTAKGRVLPALTIVNRADEIRAEYGIIPTTEVRSVTLANVLVDTGAKMLCLPAETIAQLGLNVLKEVDVATAEGIRTTRIFQDANLRICGREGTFECLELPGGGDALLGVIPLEMLGLELDLQKQKLRVLPSESLQTYLTIY